METNFAEQQNKTVSLYETTLNYLSEINILDGLIKIQTKINEPNYVMTHLNSDEYKLLGSIGFIYGIQFINQKEPNYFVMINLKERFEKINFTIDCMKTFEDIVTKLDSVIIETTNENNKNLILSDANFNNDEFYFLSSRINKILNSSTFPVGYTIQVNEFLNKKSYNYGDLLKIIRLLFEDCEFTGSVFQILSEIQNYPSFLKSVDDAQKIYDDQKFSVVYLDALFSMKEYFSQDVNIVEGNLTYKELLTNDELLENLRVNSEQQKESLDNLETEKVVETIDVENDEVKDISVEDTDLFVKELLSENSEAPIETLDDLINAIKISMDNEDLFQRLYHYLSHNKANNRREFNEIYSFDYDEFISKLEGILSEESNNYKQAVEAYLAPIDDVKLSVIKNLIKNVISVIIVDSNIQRKSYLYQQYMSNGVSTYKHLHQILDLIEQSKITGTKHNIDVYVKMYDTLNSDDTIKNVFETAYQFEAMQMKINYFHAFKAFYMLDIETPTQN